MLARASRSPRTRQTHAQTHQHFADELYRFRGNSLCVFNLLGEVDTRIVSATMAMAYEFALAERQEVCGRADTIHS